MFKVISVIIIHLLVCTVFSEDLERHEFIVNIVHYVPSNTTAETLFVCFGTIITTKHVLSSGSCLRMTARNRILGIEVQKTIGI